METSEVLVNERVVSLYPLRETLRRLSGTRLTRVSEGASRRFRKSPGLDVVLGPFLTPLLPQVLTEGGDDVVDPGTLPV